MGIEFQFGSVVGSSTEEDGIMGNLEEKENRMREKLKWQGEGVEFTRRIFNLVGIDSIPNPIRLSTQISELKQFHHFKRSDGFQTCSLISAQFCLFQFLSIIQFSSVQFRSFQFNLVALNFSHGHIPKERPPNSFILFLFQKRKKSDLSLKPVKLQQKVTVSLKKKFFTKQREKGERKSRERKRMPFISQIERQTDYRLFPSTSPIVIDNGGSYFRIGYFLTLIFQLLFFFSHFHLLLLD